MYQYSIVLDYKSDPEEVIVLTEQAFTNKELIEMVVACMVETIIDGFEFGKHDREPRLQIDLMLHEVQYIRSYITDVILDLIKYDDFYTKFRQKLSKRGFTVITPKSVRICSFYGGSSTSENLKQAFIQELLRLRE